MAINKIRSLLFVLTFSFVLISHFSMAQKADVLSSLPELKEYKKVGRIQSRHSKEIHSSNWSVGAEMMDREYTIYQNWKDYLGPLGVKKARIQSGWARCEKVKGQYDWEWLDEIVSDMVSQGVEPWVNLSYGNLIYAGGGETTLMGQIPQGPEALAAWNNYVRAIVTRYQSAVDEWEVWNEPNYRIDYEKYADFLILSAEAIKSVKPGAKVIAFALGSGVDYKFADKVLEIINHKGKISLIDEISHHRHIKVPEERTAEIELEKVVRKYSESIKIRQGEAGCPSQWNDNFALNKYNWTELTQAKHILRRLLFDLGHDKESCCFTIMDAKYPQEWNHKGLLKANEDKTVAYAKPAYYAFQNLLAVFDDQIFRLPDFSFHLQNVENADIAVYAYQGRSKPGQIITLWEKGRIPSDTTTLRTCNIDLPQGDFDQPVLVDMLSGNVWQIPRKNFKKRGVHCTFKNIPVPDYPVLIAEKSLLKIIPVK